MRTNILIILIIFIGGCASSSNYVSSSNVNIDPKLLKKTLGIYWYSGRKIESVESCIASSEKEFNVPENPNEFDACYMVTTNNNASTLKIESIVWEKDGQYYESKGASIVTVTTR